MKTRRFVFHALLPPSLPSSLLIGSTKLCDGDDEIDDAVFSDGIVSGGIAMAKKYRGSHRGSTPTQQPKGGQQYDYGCLRKVVRRGFPYDFSVDRKCVWQFCLFEQFSDTHLKLSVKDQVGHACMHPYIHLYQHYITALLTNKYAGDHASCRLPRKSWRLQLWL